MDGIDTSPRVSSSRIPVKERIKPALTNNLMHYHPSTLREKCGQRMENPYTFELFPLLYLFQYDMARLKVILFI